MRLWPRAVGALAIVVLVLLTNEGYRQLRGLIDSVDQSKKDIASLKRDLYVLQVQVDNSPVPSPGPVTAPAPEGVHYSFPSAVPTTYPMPIPIGKVLPLPEASEGPKATPQKPEEPKSLVSVVLMKDEKAIPTGAAAAAAGAKSVDGPKMDVKLIGDSK
jgi:hypothetical protein